MGGKKKKYNARFPPARIKKIMQTDEEVGKIAAPVPVVISRALELFLESIITKSVNKASESSARTLTSSHIKSVIHANKAFDFLKTQVTLIPDLSTDAGESSSTASERLSTADASSSLSNHAQHASGDSSASSAPRKRSRPASTTVQEQSDLNDPKKLKKKRGRPPKVKSEVNDEEVKFAIPGSTQSLSSTLPSSQDQKIPANGHPKEEPAVPLHTPPTYHSTVPPITQPESIFSIESTLLSKSGYASPAAHSGAAITRHITSNYSVPNASSLHNLSPSCQPMDLSTKPADASDNEPFDYSSNAGVHAGVHANAQSGVPMNVPAGNGDISAHIPATIPTNASYTSSTAADDDYDV